MWNVTNADKKMQPLIQQTLYFLYEACPNNGPKVFGQNISSLKDWYKELDV
jgi:hypothetical protein